MRLVVLSMVLPLAFGLAACVAPGAESFESEPAPADEVAAAETTSREITEKVTQIVTNINELMRLNQQWTERLKGDTTKPAVQREIAETVRQMRELLAKLPAEAAWVTGYVEHHRDAIEAGFTSALASDQVKKKIEADKIQKLTEAVNRKGGVDGIILAASTVVRDHSKDVSDMIGQGKKIPPGFVLALLVTIAGAAAADEAWLGVVGPMYGLLQIGAIR